MERVKRKSKADKELQHKVELLKELLEIRKRKLPDNSIENTEEHEKQREAIHSLLEVRKKWDKYLIKFKDIRPMTKKSLKLSLLPERSLDPPEAPTKKWRQYLFLDDKES